MMVHETLALSFLKAIERSHLTQRGYCLLKKHKCDNTGFVGWQWVFKQIPIEMGMRILHFLEFTSQLPSECFIEEMLTKSRWPMNKMMWGFPKLPTVYEKDTVIWLVNNCDALIFTWPALVKETDEYFDLSVKIVNKSMQWMKWFNCGVIPFAF